MAVIDTQPGTIALDALPAELNAAAYFVDRNVREGRGERVAIECGDQRVTYRQVLEQTNRVGNALRTSWAYAARSGCCCSCWIAPSSPTRSSAP